MPVVVGIIQVVLMVFITLLYGRFAISLIALFSREWKPRGMALLLVEGTLSITDPPVRAARAILPPIRFGNIHFDLSVLILIILATMALYLLPLA